MEVCNFKVGLHYTNLKKKKLLNRGPCSAGQRAKHVIARVDVFLQFQNDVLHFFSIMSAYTKGYELIFKIGKCVIIDHEQQIIIGIGVIKTKLYMFFFCLRFFICALKQNHFDFTLPPTEM